MLSMSHTVAQRPTVSGSGAGVGVEHVQTHAIGDESTSPGVGTPSHPSFTPFSLGRSAVLFVAISRTAWECAPFLSTPWYATGACKTEGLAQRVGHPLLILCSANHITVVTVSQVAPGLSIVGALVNVNYHCFTRLIIDVPGCERICG